MYKTPYWEQESTCVNSRLLISTKWDQKLSTLNTSVKSIGYHITPIGYRISKTKDKMKLVGCECPISPSKFFTGKTQEHFFACLSPLFNSKQNITPLSLLWRIKNSVFRTSKYLCKLTPANIHKVRSKIKHNQRLCSNSWQPNNSGEVLKFRSQRQNKTSVLWVPKISFTAIYRKKTQEWFFVACLSPLFQYIFFGSKNDHGWKKLNI